MTRSDDQMQGALPTQKLEWVTPKISLLDAGDTTGTGKTPSDTKERIWQTLTNGGPLGGPS